MKHNLITIVFACAAALPAQDQPPQTKPTQQTQDHHGAQQRARAHDRATAQQDGQGVFKEKVVDGWTAEWRQFAANHPGAALGIRLKADADGNGVIENDEQKAAMTAVQQWRHEHVQDEWKDFQAEHPDAAKKLRGAIDANGDGKIDANEANAAHDKMQGVRAERRAHWEQWAKEHPDAAQKAIQRIDTNGDGKVEPEERQQARQKLQQGQQTLKAQQAQKAQKEHPTPAPGGVRPRRNH